MKVLCFGKLFSSGQPGTIDYLICGCETASSQCFVNAGAEPVRHTLDLGVCLTGSWPYSGSGNI